jgi:RNA polymerase sigma factor (sigma-70 family)
MLTTSKTLLENISLLDPNAWEEFVKTYYPIIHKWVRKLIDNREDAEDKIQDIFLEIHKSIIRFEHRGKGTFRKWLKTICFRKIIDYQRNLKTTISTEFLISMDSLEASEIGMEWDSNYVEKTTEAAMNFVKMRFSKDDWDNLNHSLVQLVHDNESEIDYTEIHDQHSVWADTLTIDDSNKMTTVYYDKNRKIDSFEII